MLDLLNLLPINLTMRILIYTSGMCTIIFFIMTICQMIRTLWEMAHPDADWHVLPKIVKNGHRIHANDLNVKRQRFNLLNLKNGLVRDFWLGLLLIAIFILIFPLFHI